MAIPFPQVISNFRLDAFQTIPVLTLRSLGFKTRIILSNDSHFSKNETDYRINLRVFNPDGTLLQEHVDLGTMKPRERRLLDLEPFLPSQETKNQIIYVYLIPLSFEKKSKDKIHADVDRDQLREQIAVQSHQVEYYKDDGYSALVLIAPSAYNYNRHTTIPATTFIQAPKIVVSNQITSYLTLTNTSPELTYRDSHEVFLSITNTKGDVVAAWKQKIGPFQAYVVDVKTKLKELGNISNFTDRTEIYCLSAICETGTLYPTIFIHNPQVGTLGFDHTFPPNLYATGAVGPRRLDFNHALLHSKLFKELT